MGVDPRGLWTTAVLHRRPRDEPFPRTRDEPVRMDEDITRQELLRRGHTPRSIAAAVHRGDYLRLRRGHYASSASTVPVQQAVRVGGRLGCLSELRERGVWTLDDGRLHVHVQPGSSRHRDPQDRFAALNHQPGVVLHWSPLAAAAQAVPGHVALVDALAESSSCAEPWEWLASVESALHVGAAGASDVAVLRELVSSRLHPFLDRVDARSESGLETIARELCRLLGFTARQQVAFAGIGRVDLLVEGAVVVEVDGAAFHGAEVTTRDRRRDARLVARGFTVLHFRYAQVMFERDDVARAIIQAVGTHRAVRNSGRKARIALARWERQQAS